MTITQRHYHIDKMTTTKRHTTATTNDNDTKNEDNDPMNDTDNDNDSIYRYLPGYGGR